MRTCPLCKGTGELKGEQREHGVPFEAQVLALAATEELDRVVDKLAPADNDKAEGEGG